MRKENVIPEFKDFAQENPNYEDEIPQYSFISREFINYNNRNHHNHMFPSSRERPSDRTMMKQ